MLKFIKEGWVLVLDDDDELLTEDALAKLAKYMTHENEDKLIICKFALGGRIMPHNWEHGFVMNDIPCSSVVFHSKHKDLAKYHGNYSGDYHAARNLYNNLEPIWVNEVIAGTQVASSTGSMEQRPYRPWRPRIVQQSGEQETFLSIVIPVMNQVEYTKAILLNIEETCTDVPHEVIVIDNGSTDETSEVLKVANVKILTNPTNEGMSKAWNQGLLHARGSHVAILNNDLLLPDGWAQTLLAHQEHAICPLYEQGGDPASDFVERNKKLKTAPMEITKADLPGLHPKGFAGFCFMLSREVIETVGTFDEGYRYWFGDTDYWHRMREFGFNPVQSHNVLIHHYGSKTLATCTDFDAIKSKELAHFNERWPGGLSSVLERWVEEPICQTS
jgi:GT2 family glycosyltransferase